MTLISSQTVSDDEIAAQVALEFKAARFGRGRITVARCCTPPDEGFEARWKPKLCGEFIRNGGDPPHGFKTADEARAAARKYRDDCRAFVARSTGRPFK